MISTKAKNDEFDLTRNHPAPAHSHSLFERISQIGGKNPFGEPNFRIVWGQSERKIAFGALHMKYIIGRAVRWEHGMKNGVHTRERIVEEIGLPRFILEEWMPPDFSGTEEQWESRRYNWINGVREDNLGPYPRRGRYVHYYTIETDDGKFRQPDQRELDLVAMAVWSRNHPNTEAPEDLTKSILDAQEEREDLLQQELREEINLHYNRLTEGSHRANKGKSGHRVFLNNPTE